MVAGTAMKLEPGAARDSLTNIILQPLWRSAPATMKRATRAHNLQLS